MGMSSKTKLIGLGLCYPVYIYPQNMDNKHIGLLPVSICTEK
jgi:hypothetical protein